MKPEIARKCELTALATTYRQAAERVRKEIKDAEDMGFDWEEWLAMKARLVTHYDDIAGEAYAELLEMGEQI